MELITMKIADIIPYENNPRINEQAVEAVKESIRQCGYVAPIIVDENNVILAGHTRIKALQSMGEKQTEVIVRRGLTDEQKKKYRILDNKTAEIAEWDFDKLEIELEDLDFDGFDFGFDDLDFEDEEEKPAENIYTSKVDIPQYEPSGEDVQLADCVEQVKYEELMQHIKVSHVSDDEKMFLLLAAARHLCFNYKKIADYYAGKASKEMQELMEESALVIIDYNDAIKNGYAVLRKTVTDLMTEDGYGEE